MKNVVINKIVKYVFTEGQMKSKWKSLGEDLAYDSLTEQQLMDFAKSILSRASHSELEHYMLESEWRSEKEAQGKMIAEDDSDPNIHIELIDTSAENNSADIFIDRMQQLKCEQCGFEFFIEDLDADLNELHCPKDGGEVVKSIRQKRINKN
ncbi:MAG TPA: hypothetical protein VFK44_08350 [Bacillales bacterium]|nr:hypothetical protein [Bacillales bacterium]